MVRGLYTAASGMLTLEERTATTSNNLANVDTAGFKSDMLAFTAAPSFKTYRTGDPTTAGRDGRPIPQYIGMTNAGVDDTEVWRDFSPGAPQMTENPLDITIIDPPGSRTVSMLRVMPQDGSGQLAYSRDGQLLITQDGYLADNQGRRVQGDSEDIRIDNPVNAYIDSSGTVYDGDKATVGRLSLARFDDPQQQLEKVGNSLWRVKNETGATAPGGNALDNGTALQPSSFERSNADAVSSIIELITNLRQYEASQKVIQSEDTALNIAANQVGKTSPA